jgi:LuxR family transcriptional regulator, maltose regulon positive regulatory protein
MSIASTKLQPPRPRNAVLQRPRLVGRLTGSLPKLVLFCAPAGFGKTTLALEWLATLGMPAAWLSLDDYDNDPARFAARLAASLHALDPDANGTDTRAAQPAPEPMHSPFPAAPDGVDDDGLIEGLVARGARGVIVLDDYQRIEEPAIHQRVRRLSEHLGGDLHLLLLT